LIQSARAKKRNWEIARETLKWLSTAQRGCFYGEVEVIVSVTMSGPGIWDEVCGAKSFHCGHTSTPLA